jgi:hypothetical protein
MLFEKEQTEALKRQIEEWVKVLCGEAEAEVLPCCEKYDAESVFDHECMGCPISQYVGETVCWGTPYHHWWRHACSQHPGVEDLKILCPECRKIAYEELKFLCDLLKRTILFRKFT